MPALVDRPKAAFTPALPHGCLHSPPSPLRLGLIGDLLDGFRRIAAPAVSADVTARRRVGDGLDAVEFPYPVPGPRQSVPDRRQAVGPPVPAAIPGPRALKLRPAAIRAGQKPRLARDPLLLAPLLTADRGYALATGS